MVLNVALIRLSDERLILIKVKVLESKSVGKYLQLFLFFVKGDSY